MDVVYNVLVVLHFVGLASLLGGWLAQLGARDGRVMNLAMLHGVLTQLVTGIALVGLGSAVDSLPGPDNAKITVKLVVALVIAVLVWANRQRASVPGGVFLGVGLLSLANVVIAVFW